jgi:FkbM family methyltransferase
MASSLTEFLHRFKPLRNMAKKVYRFKTIKQPFYGGVLFFNAVDFSFLWTNLAKAETHDRSIQDALLEISKTKDVFIDIGSNIGIMTMSVALRNPGIMVKAFDPNPDILKYLRKSVTTSDLSGRITIINAAVSDYSGKAFMNFSKGSYAGHLASSGFEVEVKDFKELLAEYKTTKAVFKLDIEGFEKLLIPVLAQQKNALHTYVIEMHPPGLNNISDPEAGLAILLENGFTVKSVTGALITGRSQIESWDNIICSYEA